MFLYIFLIKGTTPSLEIFKFTFPEIFVKTQTFIFGTLSYNEDLKKC